MYNIAVLPIVHVVCESRIVFQGFINDPITPVIVLVIIDCMVLMLLLEIIYLPLEWLKPCTSPLHCATGEKFKFQKGPF